MAPGEAPRLGAHARLACRVCGARAGAVPSDRCRRRARAPHASPVPPARTAPDRPSALGAHQVTNISQAGALSASNATRGAAARRGAPNPCASRRPSAAAATPRHRQRTRNARNHCNST